MATTDDIRPPEGQILQPAPPAGWYDDPEVPGQRRYWDGSQWTEHRDRGAVPGPGAPAAPQRKPRRPWYRRPSAWALIVVASIIPVGLGFIAVNGVITESKRRDARAEFNKFDTKIRTAHNRAVLEGNALVLCWNAASTPEELAARCGSSCVSCTRTARAESRDLRAEYRRSPDYVQDVYRDFYRAEQRHLAGLASLGTVTKRALDAIKRGDTAAFFSRYQAQAQRVPVRLKRLERRVDRAAAQVKAKRERYLDSL